MANLKVYITQEYGMVNAVYATLSMCDIAQLKLAYDVKQYVPGSGNRYSFTESANPVDMVLEFQPKDFANVKQGLTDYTSYIPWGNFGLKYHNTPSDFIAQAED